MPYLQGDGADAMWAYIIKLAPKDLHPCAQSQALQLQLSLSCATATPKAAAGGTAPAPFPAWPNWMSQGRSAKTDRISTDFHLPRD